MLRLKRQAKRGVTFRPSRLLRTSRMRHVAIQPAPPSFETPNLVSRRRVAHRLGNWWRRNPNAANGSETLSHYVSGQKGAVTVELHNVRLAPQSPARIARQHIRRPLLLPPLSDYRERVASVSHGSDCRRLHQAWRPSLQPTLGLARASHEN
ncbi:hypothetical protein BN2475_1170003 [Paraburkholderia ribeironis]|uniref:Uncharacterized protein n=1 Tax=Paraburkholderia ribeironis TaxID=1247936 RepID=A0A1N7SNM0_9BURK|nr:hypothetical protein BN2475_1170003 [Paraburkholderia ribeironis]